MRSIVFVAVLGLLACAGQQHPPDQLARRSYDQPLADVWDAAVAAARQLGWQVWMEPLNHRLYVRPMVEGEEYVSVHVSKDGDGQTVVELTATGELHGLLSASDDRVRQFLPQMESQMGIQSP